MPVNGSAVALLPEPVSPATDSAIEQRIGEVLVLLAVEGMRACFEIQADRHMHPDTKARGGALIGELIAAQAKFNGSFADVVTRVGRNRYCAAGLGEAAADRTISGILEMVGRINAAARAMAN